MRSGTLRAGGTSELVTEVTLRAGQGATLRIAAPPRQQNDRGPNGVGYVVGIAVAPA